MPNRIIFIGHMSIYDFDFQTDAISYHKCSHFVGILTFSLNPNSLKVRWEKKNKWLIEQRFENIVFFQIHYITFLSTIHVFFVFDVDFKFKNIDTLSKDYHFKMIMMTFFVFFTYVSTSISRMQNSVWASSISWTLEFTIFFKMNFFTNDYCYWRSSWDQTKCVL